MQALSLSVHIPLVCFGIAFPALVLFAEWRYLRTGDPLYRTLARRWSKIMLALFAVGVVTGTILSFELGLLWPVWIADRFGGCDWVVLRHLGQRVDEPSQRVCVERRTGGGRAPVVGAVRQPVLLRRGRAHVLRGLHRVRVPDGRRVRVGHAARAAGAVRADGAGHLAFCRGGRLAAAGGGGRLGGAGRSRLSTGQAGRDGRAGPDHLVFAGPAWALGIGALLLVACAVAVFALTAIPDQET